MADADATQAERLVNFLVERPSSALKTPIVPRLGAREWGEKAIVNLAKRTDLPLPFSKALNQEMKVKK